MTLWTDRLAVVAAMIVQLLCLPMAQTAYPQSFCLQLLHCVRDPGPLQQVQGGQNHLDRQESKMHPAVPDEAAGKVEVHGAAKFAD